MFELSQRELEQLAETHQESIHDVEDLQQKLKVRGFTNSTTQLD